MSSIESLLDEMRGRLGMYLGTTSLTKLAAFLRGYDYALDRGKPDTFLTEFRDWIHQRYRTVDYSWEDVIVQQSADEADAVERFWHLFDEYRAQTRNGSGVAPQLSGKT